MRKDQEGFDPRFPFASRAHYETAECKDCHNREAKAESRGRDPRKAVCPGCQARREVAEPMVGIRYGFERVDLSAPAA